jgi:putative ABC transport system permease protein
MKYVPLLWAGVCRKKMRVLLTMLSVMIAFLLFGLLSGVSTAFENAGQNDSLSRLISRSRVSYTEPLPLNYRNQIAALPGVDSVSFAVWFGGYFRDPKDYIVSFAVEPEAYFRLYPDLRISPAALAEFVRDRGTAVIGAALAEKYRWHVGDEVPVKSAIWPRKDGGAAWPLRIVGIFDDQRDPTQRRLMFLHYDYFDDMRTFGTGTVGWFITHVTDPTRADAVSEAIDTRFRNSGAETKTASEQEDTAAFIRQRGDISLITRAILASVFFSLLFLTANTVMQTRREAMPQTAVLKTIGFSSTTVFALALAETSVYFVVAAAAGLAIAAVVFPSLRDYVNLPGLPLRDIAAGIGLAVLAALLTSLPGALAAQRLGVIDALRSRD